MEETRTCLYLSEFNMGDKWITPARTVTESDVTLFAGMTGDNNPLHTNEAHCKKTRFGGRIAHGILVSSIAVGLWCRMGKMDGSAIAALSTQWKFMAPVHLGDTIHCEMEVAGIKRSNSKPQQGVLDIQYTVKNEDDVVCQIGNMQTMLHWEAPEA